MYLWGMRRARTASNVSAATHWRCVVGWWMCGMYGESDTHRRTINLSLRCVRAFVPRLLTGVGLDTQANITSFAYTFQWHTQVVRLCTSSRTCSILIHTLRAQVKLVEVHLFCPKLKCKMRTSVCSTITNTTRCFSTSANNASPDA